VSCPSLNPLILEPYILKAVSEILKEFIAEPKIAYFSMEIGLKNEIPTYSGGLGVLAGDTIRSSADLNLPLDRT
jgi:glucan phosphorylase